jgi:hypothetical protein
MDLMVQSRISEEEARLERSVGLPEGYVAFESVQESEPGRVVLEHVSYLWVIVEAFAELLMAPQGLIASVLLLLQDPFISLASVEVLQVGDVLSSRPTVPSLEDGFKEWVNGVHLIKFIQ